MNRETRQPDTFPFGQQIVWQPNPAWMAASNLQRFMDRHAIASYDDTAARSVDDIAWFWDAVLADLDIQFYHPYSQVVDQSDGIDRPRWCVDGEMNIIHNCLDKWQTTPARDAARPALGGGRGRDASPDLRRTQRRSLPLRQRPAQSGHGQGRCGRPLHADDPRTGHRLSGHRQDRRRDSAPLQRLRPQRAWPPAWPTPTPKPSSRPMACSAAASAVRDEADRWTRRWPMCPTVEHVIVVERVGGLDVAMHAGPRSLVA